MSLPKSPRVDMIWDNIQQQLIWSIYVSEVTWDSDNLLKHK